MDEERPRSPQSESRNGMATTFSFYAANSLTELFSANSMRQDSEVSIV